MNKRGVIDFAGFIFILAAFYAAGYGLVTVASLSISPGVVGTILLLVALVSLPKLRTRYYPSTLVLFSHFPLFVLPAAVGIMTAVSYFAQHPLLILWVILGSTLLSIIFTALVVRLLIGKIQ